MCHTLSKGLNHLRTGAAGAALLSLAATAPASAFTPVAWADAGGGLGSDFAEAAALDPATGDVYVVGNFTGLATFGPFTFFSAGLMDGFIAKYDPSGAIIWVFHVAGFGMDIIHDVAVDAAGDILITGEFDGPVFDLGLGPIPNLGLTDVFVAKLDPSGAPIWYSTWGGAGADAGLSVIADGSDPVVVGEFSGVADFGTGAIPSAGLTDVFVARYDGFGGPLWSLGAGGFGVDAARAVEIDAGGDIVVAGEFEGVLDFGVGPMPSFGLGDAELAKYDLTGAPVWAMTMGGAGADFGFEVDSDASGEAVVAGHFSGAASFTGPVLVSFGMLDGFSMRVDPGGAVKCLDQCGGAGDDTGFDVILDGPETTLVGGFMAAGAFGGIVLPALGMDDMYVARFGFPGPVGAPVVAAGPEAAPIRTVGANPFRTETALEFTAAAAGEHVRVDLYDIRGRRIRSLFDRTAAAGVTRLDWDGTDAAGRRVATGTYFARLAGEGRSETEKLVVLR